jgi:hypothetical protein
MGNALTCSLRTEGTTGRVHAAPEKVRDRMGAVENRA